MAWSGFLSFRIGASVGKFPGSIKCGELLEELRNDQLLKKGPAE